MWLAGAHGNAERNKRPDCRPSEHAPPSNSFQTSLTIWMGRVANWIHC